MDSSDQDLPKGEHTDEGIVATIRSLTSRGSLLKSLHLILNAHSIISVTDTEARMVYVNDRFCEITKYSREELLGQHRGMLRSEAHTESFFSELWSTVASGEIWTGDIQNRAKDGALIWLQSTVAPIFDKQQEIAGYAMIQTDVTARRTQIEEITNKEQQAKLVLQDALDSIDSSLSVVDGNGTILATNKTHTVMYPDTVEEEQPGAPILPVIAKRRPDLTGEELDDYLQQMLSTNTSETRRLGDGRTVQVRRTVRPEGGYISLHTDISDIVRQGELLEQQAATMDLMTAIAVDANESPDTETAYATCLERICKFADWQVGHTYLLEEGVTDRCYSGSSWFAMDRERYASFREVSDGIEYEIGVGLPGVALQEDGPVWIRDVTLRDDFPRAKPAGDCGLIGGAAFPVRVRNEVVAVLEFFASRPLEPTPEIEEIMAHVCNQVGRVAERERSEKQVMGRVAEELRKRDKELLNEKMRLDAALSHMSHGLCMFDKDQRLIISNNAYAEIYGLPSELMRPGITLREILQYRIDNGLFSCGSPEEYIKERMEWVKQGSYSTTTQPLSDGRTISITHQPMPGGGWLTTHEDISERVRSQQALHESQELLTKAFRASPAAMAISDPEKGHHLEVNNAWCTILGHTREEAMKNTVFELGVWQDNREREKFLDRIRKDGHATGFEAIFQTKDKRPLNVLTSGEMVDVGGVSRLLIVWHDITERKQAEEALQKSESRFKNLVESTNVVPWEFDPNAMRFTYVGPQAVGLLGYPIEDWYEEDFWVRTIHPCDQDRIVRICTDATSRGEDHDFEYRFISAKGDEIWVRDVVSVVSKDGVPISLRGVLIDISERKKASEALVDSEQRFKDIAEIASDWFWECDENLRFTFLSDRFTEITNVPAENIIGKTRNEVGEGNDTNWEQHLADLEAHRPFREFRYSVKDADGDMHHWSVSGQPVFDKSGTFRGYRGTGYDRTAEVEAEAELIRHRDHLQDMVNEATAELNERAEALRQALAKEKELNELQRQFVSMASHEFRTPLAIIDSTAQRMKRKAMEKVPDDTLKRVEVIRGAVERMTRLMESTLIAARLENGGASITCGDCEIRKLLREICETQQELANGHTISFSPGDIPNSIRADAGAIEQVFTNLLSNAVKYSPDSPEIRITAALNGDMIEIAVQDQGLGIDAEDLPNMFQRFFRAKTSTGIAGTGIGLNLVKTLIELHGGAISVESRKGEGSTFTVCLPVDGPATATEGKHEAA